MRKYKSGSSFALWRWTEVDSEYITRLHVIKTPLFAICVHWIKKPDPEPYQHDHPVSFISFILSGGYKEFRFKNKAYADITRFWINTFSASPEDRHTITDVAPNTVTLCFMGPKTRDWGFHTPEGWVMWKDYYAKQRAEKETT